MTTGNLSLLTTAFLFSYAWYQFWNCQVLSSMLVQQIQVPIRYEKQGFKSSQIFFLINFLTDNKVQQRKYYLMPSAIGKYWCSGWCLSLYCADSEAKVAFSLFLRGAWLCWDARGQVCVCWSYVSKNEVFWGVMKTSLFPLHRKRNKQQRKKNDQCQHQTLKSQIKNKKQIVILNIGSSIEKTTHSLSHVTPTNNPQPTHIQIRQQNLKFERLDVENIGYC